MGDSQVAYRLLGPEGGTPLLLLNRFRGTMDHWDPLLLDRIARERQIVLFDQPGFARSSGPPPDSQAAFAFSAAEVVRSLGFGQVDVLGFSMGGTVALKMALDHPALVRRMIVAGSGPGHVPDIPPASVNTDPRVWPTAIKPVNDDDDFLFLFFGPSSLSQEAGNAHLARIKQRADAFLRQVDTDAWNGQLKAAMEVGTPATSLLPSLASIVQPALIANGNCDIMVPTYASFAMQQALPNARLLVYPDSGHGFLFQYPEDFADEVLRFLK
ncbi:MAG: alpha/beta hydrolase [Polaromonas sp.]|nr:alpha/beta hydrolase [Polaromonas sp.]